MAELGFGLMRLPLRDPDDQRSIDMDVLNDMVDAFLDAGLDYFDTAYMYHDGMSEVAIREALVKRHPRDSFRLATKMPLMMIGSEEDHARIFNEQLERCGVEYFDYYLLHNICTQFYGTAERLGTFDFVARMKKEGRIRKMGFSFHDGSAMLEEVLEKHSDVIDFIQLQINYMDWESESIDSRRCYEIARRYGIPIIVMEPVKGGALANVPDEVGEMFESELPGMSPASWAIRFVASLEGVETVLSGMSDMDQMRDNLSYMADFRPMGESELEVIERAVKAINDSIAIPCTACRYCMKSCPKDILIAEYFSLYNSDMKAPSTNGFSIHQLYYTNHAKGHGKASDCIGCGNCERNCPQHIGIIDCLKEVADRFEAQ